MRGLRVVSSPSVSWGPLGSAAQARPARAQRRAWTRELAADLPAPLAAGVLLAVPIGVKLKSLNPLVRRQLRLAVQDCPRCQLRRAAGAGGGTQAARAAALQVYLGLTGTLIDLKTGATSSTSPRLRSCGRCLARSCPGAARHVASLPHPTNRLLPVHGAEGGVHGAAPASRICRGSRARLGSRARGSCTAGGPSPSARRGWNVLLPVRRAPSAALARAGRGFESRARAAAHSPTFAPLRPPRLRKLP